MTAGGPRSTRWATILLAAVLLVLGVAAPAMADPAGPTHYDSRVTAVEVDGGGRIGASFEVLGGDAFLVVRAEPGTEVEVPGYEGEPYVRIGPDGTVEVNQRSPSRWVNDERYVLAAPDVPADVAVDAPPRWEVVATDGAFAWHDHRIHWMTPSLPRQVDASAGSPQPVDDWVVPLVVDGREVTVSGSLTWQPGPSPSLPVVLVLVAVAVGVVAGWARPALLPALLVAGMVLALVVGAAGNLGLPAGADGELFLFVLPVLALGLAAGGMAIGRRDARAAAHRVRGRVVTAAAGVPLLVWAVLQAGALTRPIVPGPLPVGLVRVAVVTAAAAGLAGVLGVARTVLAATALDAEPVRSD